jgi:carboxyl-terminal processing protease
VEASCQAADDVTRPLGDPQEASVRTALDYLAGRPCNRIATGATTQSLREGRRELVTPERPSVAQREVPGLF